MDGQKPPISVLMAVYEPPMDWLREQLCSLEAQDWPNLRLYIRDDASPTVPLEDIRRCAEECLHRLPWTLERNGENLGSNETFARLTAEAEGDYFAYCDQDDVWLPGKLTVLYETMEHSGALLACSDMVVIDAAGRVMAQSITRLRPCHIFRSGEGLWDTLWYSNFVSGCAMLVRAEEARRALPFDPYMYYDHHIALCCSDRGRIESLPQSLLLHREHGDNQSSLLRGVEDKESYFRIRVENKYRAVCWLCENMSFSPALMERLRAGRDWLAARQAYLRGDRRRAGELWRSRALSPRSTVLELAMPFLPEWALRGVLALVKRNML